MEAHLGKMQAQKPGGMVRILRPWALLGLAGLVAGLLLAACTSATPSGTPPAGTSIPSPPATATALPPGEPTPTTPLTLSTDITVTLWWPDALHPNEDSEGSQVLHNQIDAFEEANPNVKVEYLVKRAYGPGGTVDLLQSAYNVAPSILPDLVVLDDQELGEAVRAGVLQPLDGLVSQTLLDDLYPFAVGVGRFAEGQMALEFTADIEHLAYNTQKVPSPPVTWTEVLSGTARYIFPAAGHQGWVNDSFLIQYLALGGRLVDENGQPALDEQLLARALGFYAKGVERKVIRSVVLELETLDQCWEKLLAGGPWMSNVSAAQFLGEREDHLTMRFAPLPTWNGTVTNMSHGWVMVIVAQDQPHQQAAARLLTWLMDPPRNAAWSLSAVLLPARREALAFLGNEDPYYPFLHWQLESAHFHPTSPSYEAIAQALQNAVREVLSGTATPEEAARQVLKTLGQSTE